jgi:prophage tail gpP-like protein
MAKVTAANYKDFYLTRPKPEAGTYYTVPEGAWLDTISQATYGYDRVDDIIKANDYLQDREIIRGTAAAELPTIHPGDILWLPEAETPDEPDTITAQTPDEVAIRIDGKIFRGWETSSITRSIETCADSFTFVAPFDPAGENLRYLTPQTYLKADLFVGGNLYISGKVYKHDYSAGESASVSIEVRSNPGVTVDCMSTDKKLNYNNLTLKQIAEKTLRPFSIKFDFPFGDTDVFTKANREPTDTVFGFLSKLASQKGYMITSSIDSKMLFIRADLESSPVASLIQGQQPLIDVGASYDSSKIFSDYIAIGQGPGKTKIKAQVHNPFVNDYRPLIFSAQNVVEGNILNTAKWKMSRSIAASAGITATVKGWRDPNGFLWVENKKVILHFPKRAIFRETEFLITGINLTKDEAGGNIANLTLVLPQAYTLELPEGLPWIP